MLSSISDTILSIIDFVAKHKNIMTLFKLLIFVILCYLGGILTGYIYVSYIDLQNININMTIFVYFPCFINIICVTIIMVTHTINVCCCNYTFINDTSAQLVNLAHNDHTSIVTNSLTYLESGTDTDVILDLSHYSSHHPDENDRSETTIDKSETTIDKSETTVDKFDFYYRNLDLPEVQYNRLCNDNFTNENTYLLNK